MRRNVSERKLPLDLPFEISPLFRTLHLGDGGTLAKILGPRLDDSLVNLRKEMTTLTAKLVRRWQSTPSSAFLLASHMPRQHVRCLQRQVLTVISEYGRPQNQSPRLLW